MVFMFFSLGIAAAFFIGSLISLNYGRRLGLQYRKHSNGESTAGLSTVEGAIFGLMGLLLAFTISGALCNGSTTDASWCSKKQRR